VRAFAVLALLAASPAFADKVVQVRGVAKVKGGDVQKAAGQALDDAKRNAVGLVVDELVEAAEREAKDKLIKAQILRDAAKYVVTFKPLDEGEDAGTAYVEIEATVADVALAARLRALKIKVIGDDAQPVGTKQTRPKVAILLVAPDEQIDPTAVGKSLEADLGAEGFGAVAIPPTRGTVDDEQAAKLARAAGAAAVVVVTLAVSDGGRIRGTRQLGAVAEISLVIVDDTGQGPTRLMQPQRPRAAAWGKDAEAARAAAIAEVARKGGRIIVPRLGARWPAAGGAAAAITVELGGVTRWQEVHQVVTAIRGTAGVDSALPGEFSRGRVLLLVTGNVLPATLVSALTGAGLAASQQGDRVVVDARAAAP
jgi:hypothetical protein